MRRLLRGFGVEADGIWAAEYTYTIYNRRFEKLQLIPVFAAQAIAAEIRLDPEEHAEYRWCSYDEAQRLVAFRGLKEELASTREYVTGRWPPLPELGLA